MKGLEMTKIERENRAALHKIQLEIQAYGERLLKQGFSFNRLSADIDDAVCLVKWLDIPCDEGLKRE